MSFGNNYYRIAQIIVSRKQRKRTEIHGNNKLGNDILFGPAPQRGSKQCPSVAVGVTAPLIGHGWPKGNPLKALFAQGDALGTYAPNIFALEGQKH